ncbi:MAG: type I-G CRISPR-associated protein Csb2 [Pseudonocardiaceae bacterium]
MLRITLRFPLGVYNAQSATSFEEAEWPVSPLRVVGALLAAAHGRHGADPSPDRAVLGRLCEASAPIIVAPESVAVGEPGTAAEFVRLRGPTRWAPRNYFSDGKGRTPASVSKAGVATGDLPVHLLWPNVDLGPTELDRLATLATDVTFIGTTRSPAIVEVSTDPPDYGKNAWVPVGAEHAEHAVSVRVPDRHSIGDFDKRHAALRSQTQGVERAGKVPGIWVGRPAQYAYAPRLRTEKAFDPRWWGDMIVLAVDTDRSEVAPKAAAAYLVARAVRLALLGAYEGAGAAAEAPPILRGRGAEPHCALVPLLHVWGERGDGRILGVGILLPHERRVADVDIQRARVEAGLRRLAVEAPDRPRRYVAILNAGRLWLTLPDAPRSQLTTLQQGSYRKPSRSWVSITPVVYSRYPKGDATLQDQVRVECSHVGLPEPRQVEIRRGPGRRGGAYRPVPTRRLPDAWRGSVVGRAGHVRITFNSPVHGPVLLGRARHFGLGLCVPDDAPADSALEHM